MARIAKPKSKVVKKDKKHKEIEQIPVLEDNKIDRIIKRIRNKVEVKYNENVHMRLLLEVYEKGGDVAQFCASAEIPRGTFYRWVNHNETFSKTYEVARELARDFFDRESSYGLHNQASFNTKMWQMLMKSRFGASDRRNIDIPGLSSAKDALGQFKCVVEALSGKQINVDEAQALASVLIAGCKISEATQLKIDVDMLKLKHGVG